MRAYLFAANALLLVAADGHGCSRDGKYEIFSDAECTTSADWKMKMLMPEPDDWEKGCYDPTDRLIIYSLKNAANDVIVALTQWEELLKSGAIPTDTWNQAKSGLNAAGI